MNAYASFSSYASPAVTYIPPSRYDHKGRLMPYAETETQRRERLAFLTRMKLQRTTHSNMSTEILDISRPHTADSLIHLEPSNDILDRLYAGLTGHLSTSGSPKKTASRKLETVPPALAPANGKRHRRQNSPLFSITEEE